MVLVLSVGLTWILVSILFGGPGSGFPRIQQLFASECPPWEGPRGGRGGCRRRLRAGVGDGGLGVLSLPGGTPLAALSLPPGVRPGLPDRPAASAGSPHPGAFEFSVHSESVGPEGGAGGSLGEDTLVAPCWLPARV